MKSSLYILLLNHLFVLTFSLDLPFGRRNHGHRKSVRPALASNQFLKNSMRSSTADSKNDVKQHGRENQQDEDIEALLRRHANADETTPAPVPKKERNLDWNSGIDEDIEILFQDDASETEEEDRNAEDVPFEKLDAMERAWRHCKKPLLRVGSKGVQFSHGNSLRQLLEAHQVVKVKVNTKRFGSLENAFDALKVLAVESGAPSDIEMVQARECEKTILFGLPGILEKIERDEFPPPPYESHQFPQP